MVTWYYKKSKYDSERKLKEPIPNCLLHLEQRIMGLPFPYSFYRLGKLKLKLTVCATVGSIGSMYCSANFIVLWNSPVYFRSALMIH